jgi:hypothetical protein
MNMHILKNSSNQWPIILFLLSLSFALVIDFPVADTPNLFSVRKAEARVGRPVSPHSAAGVHRRTRRRTTRRVAAGTRVHTLPAGCTTVINAPITKATQWCMLLKILSLNFLRASEDPA